MYNYIYIVYIFIYIYIVFRLNAKCAWIIQEIPAFMIAAIFYWEAKDDVNIVQTIVLGMFLIHYFNR